MKINQLSNAILKNDAVSNQMLAIKDTLKELGHDSKIFVRWKDQNLLDDAIITIPYPENIGYSKIPNLLIESNIVFYHYHSKSFFLQILEKLSGKKILYYHNITPSRFFKGIEPNTVKTLEEGLRDLKKVKSICPIAVGSEYNAIELKKINFSKVFEIPYYIDQKKYSPNILRFEDKNKIYDNIIFVGRIAPNKKHEEIIKCFYYYSNAYYYHILIYMIIVLYS